ncbi:DUF1853 family protein [Marinomonas sp. TW1]|uniref:DUF1853 family protein n=1 Tax=Marinomonas sp. TW1 TaxID=1561203 RepID=UPI0007AFD755|nr:DUF1853 family protein [Marinomonas sp. TW1]KZN13343.1 hypothetical protein OA79_11495 [Marinomonas sp. TW1]
MLSLNAKQVLRDLEWLVDGHYILADFQLGPYWRSDWREILTLHRHNPTSLMAKLEQTKSHFLGSYFEALFSFAISELSVLSIQREHFQITRQGKTLGEVDMLVALPDGSLQQFELAIKFYLHRADLAPNDWIGPNKNDSLVKKVTRARQHQLQILKTEEGANSIRDLSSGGDIRASLLMFGRLYRGLHTESDLDEWWREEGGAWLRASDILWLSKYFSYFIVLEKPHWLAFPCFKEDFTFFSPETAYNLVGNFLHDDRPLHLCLSSSESEANGIKRHVFVVPDTW